MVFPPPGVEELGESDEELAVDKFAGIDTLDWKGYVTSSLLNGLLAMTCKRN